MWNFSKRFAFFRRPPREKNSLLCGKSWKKIPFSRPIFSPLLTTLWISVDNLHLSTQKSLFFAFTNVDDRKMKKVIHNLSTIFCKNGEKRQNTTFFSLFRKKVKKTYQQKQEHLFTTFVYAALRPAGQCRRFALSLRKRHKNVPAPKGAFALFPLRRGAERPRRRPRRWRRGRRARQTGWEGAPLPFRGR